jgi:hypothetical protein
MYKQRAIKPVMLCICTLKEIYLLKKHKKGIAIATDM